MQFDILMQKLIQIFLLGTSGIIYFLNQLDITLFERAFDQMLSLGFLCVACYLLYREWKGAQEYNEKRDKRFEELVENNTEALNNFRDEVRNIHNRIDNNRTLIEQFNHDQSN